jgi:Tfp pilus assembly protein PilO
MIMRARERDENGHTEDYKEFSRLIKEKYALGRKDSEGRNELRLTFNKQSHNEVRLHKYLRRLVEIGRDIESLDKRAPSHYKVLINLIHSLNDSKSPFFIFEGEETR